MVFAPKPRSYRTDLNKKTRRKALFGALSDKVNENALVVIDQITATEYKTRVMADMLHAVGFEKKALVVLAEKNDMVYKSLSNIAGVKVAYANTINTYDVLNCNLLVAAKGAVEQIEEVYAS